MGARAPRLGVSKDNRHRENGDGTFDAVSSYVYDILIENVLEYGIHQPMLSRRLRPVPVEHLLQRLPQIDGSMFLIPVFLCQCLPMSVVLDVL